MTWCPKHIKWTRVITVLKKHKICTETKKAKEREKRRENADFLKMFGKKKKKNVWETCFIFQHHVSYILSEHHLDSWHWSTKLNEPILYKSGFQGINKQRRMQRFRTQMQTFQQPLIPEETDMASRHNRSHGLDP